MYINLYIPKDNKDETKKDITTKLSPPIKNKIGTIKQIITE